MKKMYLFALVALLMVTSVIATGRFLEKKVVISPELALDDFVTLYNENVSNIKSVVGDGIFTYYERADGRLLSSNGVFDARIKMSDKSLHKINFRWYADLVQSPENIVYTETDTEITIVASNGEGCTQNGFLQKKCNVVVHHIYTTPFKQVVKEDYYGPVTVVYHKTTGVTDIVTENFVLNGIMGEFKYVRFI